jgi:hypothetical protein
VLYQYPDIDVADADGAAAACALAQSPKSTRKVKQKERIRTENAKKRAQRLLKRGLLLSQSFAVPDELKRLGILSLFSRVVRSQRAESVLPRVLILRLLLDLPKLWLARFADAGGDDGATKYDASRNETVRWAA